MKKLMDNLKRALEYLTVGLTAVITALVTFEVIMRGLFDYSIVITDEASRYLMIWIVMLAASLVSQNDEHIKIDMVPKNISPTLRKSLAIGSNVLTLIFLGIFTYASLQILPGMAGDRTVTLGVSMYWIYLSLPMGGGLMLFVTAYNTYLLLLKKADSGVVATGSLPK